MVFNYVIRPERTLLLDICIHLNLRSKSWDMMTNMWKITKHGWYFSQHHGVINALISRKFGLNLQSLKIKRELIHLNKSTLTANLVQTCVNGLMSMVSLLWKLWKVTLHMNIKNHTIHMNLWIICLIENTTTQPRS